MTEKRPSLSSALIAPSFSFASSIVSVVCEAGGPTTSKTSLARSPLPETAVALASAAVTVPGLEEFVASDQPDAENLKLLTAAGNTESNVEIITGSCLSEKVIRQLFDLIPRSASSFALIDPPGYRRLRWSLVKKLARHGSDWQGHKTELLIVFPLEMALLRNLSRPECEASITRLYGNQEWLQIRQDWQEGEIDTTEVRKRLVALYQTGLKNLGYRYVASLEPAQSPHPPVYLLIWASDEANRIKMVASAWNRPRYLPGEMFYRDKQPSE